MQRFPVAESHIQAGKAKTKSILMERFLRRLTKESGEFKIEVNKIRKKYCIEFTESFLKTEKYKALKSDIKDDRVVSAFPKPMQKISKDFTKDVTLLCRHFLIPAMLKQVKNYICSGAMKGLHDQTKITITQGQIAIRTNFDIIKKDWDELWTQIEGVKESQELLQNFNDGLKPKERHKESEYFDTKMWMLKIKLMPNIPVPKIYMDKIKNMNNSQKQKWRNDIKEWKKALGYS